MSARDPADVVRGVMQALRSSDVESATSLFDENVTWLGSVGGLEPGLARGRDEVAASFRDYLSTWEELRFEGDEVLVAGERVLVLMREVARGVGSGAPVEGNSAAVFVVRDGQVVQVVSYLDQERARADFEAGVIPDALD